MKNRRVQDGKRKQCSKTVRGTKKAADAERSRIEAELRKTPAEKGFRDAGGGVLQAFSEGADW